MGRDLVQDLIGPEFKTSVHAVLNNALLGHNTANFEFPLRTKNGRAVEVLLNATPRIDFNGTLIGVVGVGQDITEKKQAEVELTRVANDLRKLSDTANAPIFGIDTHGPVNEWNQKAAEITGWPKDEVMEHELVVKFISLDYRDSVKVVLDNGLNGSMVCVYRGNQIHFKEVCRFVLFSLGDSWPQCFGGLGGWIWGES